MTMTQKNRYSDIVSIKHYNESMKDSIVTQSGIRCAKCGYQGRVYKHLETFKNINSALRLIKEIERDGVYASILVNNNEKVVYIHLKQ